MDPERLKMSFLPTPVHGVIPVGYRILLWVSPCGKYWDIFTHPVRLIVCPPRAKTPPVLRLGVLCAVMMCEIRKKQENYESIFRHTKSKSPAVALERGNFPLPNVSRSPEKLVQAWAFSKTHV